MKAMTMLILKKKNFKINKPVNSFKTKTHNNKLIKIIQMHKIQKFLIIKKILIEIMRIQETLIKILEYNKVRIDKIYK